MEEKFIINGVELSNYDIIRAFQQFVNRDDIDGFDIVLKNLHNQKCNAYKALQTYIDCCNYMKVDEDCELCVPAKILNVSNTYPYMTDMLIKLEAFRKLLICRDAYWKSFDNWKPHYQSGVDNTFYTIFRFNDKIDKGATSHRGAILAFPTEESRDYFYNCFSDLIEECSDFL